MKPSEFSQHVTEIILESISNGVFTIDHNWHITSFNRAAEEITGISREEAIGKHCWDVFRSNMCEKDCALRRTMKMGEDAVDTSTYIVNSEQIRIPVVVCTSLLKDERGNVLGGVETFRDMSTVEELRKELDGKFQIGDIVSRSKSMQRIFDLLPQVAESESTVLIQGETGTGKELLARAIHNLGPRRNGPFVAMNCGALPDTLLESELFGYKAGAFTDARRDKPGRFSVAKGGTIFLDEIGDLSPAFQVRLLRVLQERTFRPLGGTREIQADVRVITAANKDITELVSAGRFRQDLFYRINVIRLLLPALRERKEDIPLLVERFIHRFNVLRRKQISGISSRTLSVLMSHHYPGNIRELENIIEHAFVVCPVGEIEPHCLPDNLLGEIHDPLLHGSINDTLRSVETQTIYTALKRNNYNRLATASDLGIHKSTLYRKMRRLGICTPEYDGRSTRSGTE